MAGLGFQPERHSGIVLRYHLVEETPGLHGKAFAARATVCVSAAFVVFFGFPAQTQLAHDAMESLPHVVLHGSRGLNELAVEHSGTSTAL